jgi:polyribonucleotide nucleotidyltransferase
VAEAERQIRLILNPPTAGVGEVYKGKVVNITKFGAFVNILPGRDGLVHISKLGGGKRVDTVESVLSLGDDIEVRVDDIDPNGKISLTPTSVAAAADSESDPKAEAAEAADAVPSTHATPNGDAGAATADADRVLVDFDEFHDAQMRELQGDLGPAVQGAGAANRSSRPRRPRRR